MLRAMLFIMCLLLTVLGGSLASSEQKAAKTSNNKLYNSCFSKCRIDCENPSGKENVLCADIISKCKKECDKYKIEKVPEKTVEEDEQDDYLRKRELNELKKLIGVGF